MKNLKFLTASGERFFGQLIEVRRDDRRQTPLHRQLGESGVDRSVNAAVDRLPDGEIVGADLLFHQLRLKVRREELCFVSAPSERLEHLVRRLPVPAERREGVAERFQQQRIELRPRGKRRRRNRRCASPDEGYKRLLRLNEIEHRALRWIEGPLDYGIIKEEAGR